MNKTVLLLFSISVTIVSFAQTGAQSKLFVIKGGIASSTALSTSTEQNQVIEMPRQGSIPESTPPSPQTHKFYIKNQGTVDMSAPVRDFQSKLLIQELPKQSGQKIVYYNYPSTNTAAKGAGQATVAIPTPALNQSFVANRFAFGTPNDNDMAISNEGRLISVINSNIYYRNTSNDSVFQAKSLLAFKNPINNFNSAYDPKVIYDPRADRFILVCLVGTDDTTSKVVVGFSKSNKPNGQWFLYVLPGNPLNNNLWTDYPMLGLTQKELFLTANLLTNNSPWQTGFVETIIWQIKKDSGYAGKAVLGAVLHNNIKFNNRFVRNLCPVRGGSQLYGPNMYFVSNRNFASQNDSVFLVNITDTIGAPGGTLTVKAVKSNQSYYFANDALQAGTTKSLATNDSRNLGAFIENNKIQYVHNTSNPANNRISVYHGVIDNPQSAAPSASGNIIDNANGMYYGYPNISYVGSGSSDNSAIITFNHSSTQIFPGCSAIQTDGAGSYSPVLKIQDGATYVDLPSVGTLQRWGDYSGSQRRYDNPGEVWMSGYYAVNNSNQSHSHNAWVAQIFTNEKFTPVAEQAFKSADAKIFPNPASEIYSVELRLTAPEYLTFELFDAQGKLVQLLLRDKVKALDNTFTFNTRSLEKGIYILKITGNTATAISKKVVVN